MRDGSVAVRIDFPGSNFAGATIYLEDWQVRELKARVDKHNRWLWSRGRPEDYTMAHAIHSALYEYFDGLEEKRIPGSGNFQGTQVAKNSHTLIVGQKQEEIKMVKVTIEFDGGTEVFTGDAVSCVVITNKPDKVEVREALKGTLNPLRFPQILADTCFSQVKASQKNQFPLDQLEALEAFKAEVQNLMDQEIKANGGWTEVLKQILEAGKEE